jgi:hypothetical protein
MGFRRSKNLCSRKLIVDRAQYASGEREREGGGGGGDNLGGCFFEEG